MWRRLTLRVLIIVTASMAAFVFSAHAQNAPTSSSPIDFQRDGIRFQINASIKAAPGSPHVKSEDDETKVSLEVQLRISAHAMESRFFGIKAESFSGFRLAKGSEEKVFMEESRCHQRRGLPKVTVTAIDGSIQTDNGRVAIAARPRQLGRLLPPDEISAGVRHPSGFDKGGPFIVYTSQTNTSRLAVNVKIYTIDCPLKAGVR
jgi:hypothetical protein